MTEQASAAAKSERAKPLPLGVLEIQQHARRIQAVRVVYFDVQTRGEVVYPCVPDKGWRLSIVLDEVGGRVETREALFRAPPTPPVAHPIVLYPADAQLWGYSPNLNRCRYLNLIFQPDELHGRLAEHIVRGRGLTPRLRFADEDIWHIGRMIADQLSDPFSYNSLYCESLTATLIARLGKLHNARELPKRGGLTSNQLRRVIELLESKLADNVSLQQLADMVGVSQSHFINAFKASTGMPPHRWLLTARVRHAQALLISNQHRLAEVAHQTGFADQSHFTRVFRRHTGMSPARWQREQRR